MIARGRGEHDRHSRRWHPTPAREANPTASRPTPSDDVAAVAPRRLAGLRLLAAIATVVAVISVSLSVTLTRGGPATSSVQLPSSPHAWLTAYDGAAVTDPHQVCAELFSSALARAYGRLVQGTCVRYFARITSSSVTVLSALQDGATAVLELRQTLNHQHWSVVLDHRSTGWQAVDLSPSLLR